MAKTLTDNCGMAGLIHQRNCMEILQLVVAFKLGVTNPDKVPDNLKLRLNNSHNST